MLFGMTMITLRFVSFGLEWSRNQQIEPSKVEKRSENISKKDRKMEKESRSGSISHHFSYIYFLHYTLYVPLLFNGPIYNYDQFAKEVGGTQIQTNFALIHNVTNKTAMHNIMWNMSAYSEISIQEEAKIILKYYPMYKELH